MRSPASISRPRLLAFVLTLALSAVGVASATSTLQSMDEEVSALYERTKDAIVKVHAQRAPIFGGLPFGPIHRVGTGFFIDGQGHLLTAATVVSEADTFWIDWHGRKIPANVIGRDPQTNVAVLRIDPLACGGETQETPQLKCGNPGELRVGSMVIAIGFPYDQPSAPTVGFVSGFDIKCGAYTFIISHIRAGLRLSPGQGGGPLFNACGEVVGMAVAAHLDNQCYALPITAAMRVTDDILARGEPQHGWVGLSVAERELNTPGTTGGQWQVYIQEVYSNTPAALAGFRDQDVLVGICTNEIRRTADVLNSMFYYRCGESAHFTVLRDGRPVSISLVIGKRPVEDPFLPKPAQLAPIRPEVPGLVITPASGAR
ncbi:MAG TPA: S1C family serine protease [Verrucomicrobiae bacterium]|nr:S1C family serine protease [Verrucomicrobiae bacterium]